MKFPTIKPAANAKPAKPAKPAPAKPNPFAALAGKTAPTPTPAPTLHGVKTATRKALAAQSGGRKKRSNPELREETLTHLTALAREAAEPFIQSAAALAASSSPTEPAPNPFTTQSSNITTTLDESQQAAVDLSNTAQHFNITGSAGSGKTFTTARVLSNLITNGTIRRLRDIESLPSSHPRCTRPNLSHIGITSTNHFSIACCAFTGMAVKNIRKQLPRELAFNCCTIHKLLDYAPEVLEVPATAKDVQLGRAEAIGQIIEKKLFTPRVTRANPIAPDVLLIDEVSMLGLTLAENLFTALDPRTRIITVGDMAQLRPVMDTSVQPFTLSNWPSANLTKVYRQKDGDIIDAATRIRNGKAPSASPNLRIKSLDSNSPIKAQSQLRLELKAQLTSADYDPFRDICLTPWNKNELGTTILNTITRSLANPDAKRILIKTQTSNLTYSIGDRLVATKNRGDSGIFNGMLGTIIGITRNRKLDYDDDAGEFSPDSAADPTAPTLDFNAIANLQAPTTTDPTSALEGDGSRQASHTLEVIFDQAIDDTIETYARGLAARNPDNPQTIIDALSDPSTYPPLANASTNLSTSGMIEDTMLAYWITVNRAQGSGFRNVILTIHNQHAVSLCNELLYTGVTRTQNAITLLTTRYAIGKCLSKFTYSGRTVEEKVENYLTELADRGVLQPDWIPPAGIAAKPESANATAAREPDVAEVESTEPTDSTPPTTAPLKIKFKF